MMQCISQHSGFWAVHKAPDNWDLGNTERDQALNFNKMNAQVGVMKNIDVMLRILYLRSENLKNNNGWTYDNKSKNIFLFWGTHANRRTKPHFKSGNPINLQSCSVALHLLVINRRLVKLDHSGPREGDQYQQETDVRTKAGRRRKQTGDRGDRGKVQWRKNSFQRECACAVEYCGGSRMHSVLKVNVRGHGSLGNNWKHN